MGHEQRATLDIEGAIDIKRRAAQLFKRASSEYFASASAQGVYINLRMRELGLAPSAAVEMGRSLVEDPASVTDLTKTANDVHHGRGLTFTVSESDTKRIIGASFAHAFAMDVMTPDDLGSFLEEYKRRQRHGRFDEKPYRRAIYDQLTVKRIQHGLLTPVRQSFIDRIAGDIQGAVIR